MRAIFTSQLATAAAPMTRARVTSNRAAMRKTPQLCLARCCASTSRTRRALTRSRLIIPSTDRTPTNRRFSASACATLFATASIASPVRCYWRCRAVFAGRNRCAKSFQPGGGENYGGACRKAIQIRLPDDPPRQMQSIQFSIIRNTTGQTIIGGYVYRGSRIPLLSGSMCSRLPRTGNYRKNLIFRITAETCPASGYHLAIVSDARW